MRIFGRALLGAALLLSTFPAFNQAFADGSGAFEGAVITKLAGIDGHHLEGIVPRLQAPHH
jgi:hypothetical protein